MIIHPQTERSVRLRESGYARRAVRPCGRSAWRWADIHVQRACAFEHSGAQGIYPAEPVKPRTIELVESAAIQSATC